jgi:hypothetical protein
MARSTPQQSPQQLHIPPGFLRAGRLCYQAGVMAHIQNLERFLSRNFPAHSFVDKILGGRSENKADLFGLFTPLVDQLLLDLTNAVSHGDLFLIA